jgi:hypothetical protein
MVEQRCSRSDGGERPFVVAAWAESRGVFEEGAFAGVEAAAPSQRTIVATHPISQTRKAYSKGKKATEKESVQVSVSRMYMWMSIGPTLRVDATRDFYNGGDARDTAVLRASRGKHGIRQ